MKVEHTPEGATVSSVNTYSCLIDSRTKLPIESFRHYGVLYDLSGNVVPRPIQGRDYVPLFALEDSYKQIRSDGAYDYTALSGEGVRQSSGRASQIVEKGTLYPCTWERDGTYQPYTYSLVLAEAMNEKIHDTAYSWIYRAIQGEMYKPDLSSRWELTGGIIPDGVAMKAAMPLDTQDYITNSNANNQGHIVWSLGHPTSLGMYTAYTGSYRAVALDTFAGLQTDPNLEILSTMWIYPEAKLHRYGGYMQNEEGLDVGIRVDFRSTKSEQLYDKTGGGLSFSRYNTGWYTPFTECSIGTPRSV